MKTELKVLWMVSADAKARVFQYFKIEVNVNFWFQCKVFNILGYGIKNQPALCMWAYQCLGNVIVRDRPNDVCGVYDTMFYSPFNSYFSHIS